ncbi:MAG: class I SAM-dependent methyltransferase [Rhodospirillales bacterium]|jgi:SAM-dependent methyltransferase|nr:class I SAM-dependent methyltransferase [Rhodospirillales bacterium]
MSLDRYYAANKAYWNERVDVNLRNWEVDGFLADPARLTDVVSADRDAVGEVRGKSLIHLQCHFGLDTLAWSRLGARAIGVDFSPRAIAVAADLATRIDSSARFVEADLYQAPRAVPELFDIVYTSGGVLCWLADIAGWANVIDRLLKPGGVFYIREAHPVLWSLEDERDDDKLVVGLPYFERSEPLRWQGDPVWEEDGRYNTSHTVQHCWPHGLGEIVTALIDAGLTIQFLREHKSCLWQALHFMIEGDDGWWRLPDGQERLPLMYSIRAVKPR